MDSAYSIKTDALREIAVRFRMALPLNVEAREFARDLITLAVGEPDAEDQEGDDDFFLDLVDATLHIVGHSSNRADELDSLLHSAASVWRVGDDRKSLVSVVGVEAQATYDAAISVADAASAQLAEAWANAFGRQGNPSDAWDHAIKALEAVLIPQVVPKQTKPNLGHVLGQLTKQGTHWKMVLPGKDDANDVGPLAGMLQGVWPNIDRHEGTTTTRPPTEREARAVVTLAATIVQWHRDGWVVQRR